MRLRFISLNIMFAGFVLAGNIARAVPCAQVKAQPDAWVKASVNALVQTAHAAYEDDKGIPAYQRALRGIAGTLEQCKLAQDEGFANHYREFVEYIKMLSLELQPDHDLGFVVPDEQYFAETRQYVEIPEYLLAQSFLRLVSRDETLNQAKAYLHQLNAQRAADDQLIFFSYNSQHLGTPDNDNSFERLLIIVPGNPEKSVPEKWVQFGITDRGARVHIRNLSIVSAVPATDGTSQIYFKDYFRTYRPDGSINIKGRWELGYGDDNCAKCHKSGIIPIFPEPGSVSPSEQPALKAANERFLTYGIPRFENYLDNSKFGPGIGSPRWAEHAQRLAARVDGTVASHATTSCVACHQSEGLGALNWPMDSTLISSYVEGGQMPLGYQLTSAEREKLYRKLISDYFDTDDTNPGILKSWLLGKRR